MSFSLRAFARGFMQKATRASNAAPTYDYHEANATSAARLLDVTKSKVLVVGCNAGGDCKLFVDRGTPEVHGLDVIEQTGKEFPNERVTYHKQSIENCDLPSGYFDLVYSVATMEHVPDVKAGYSEMCRVTKRGGIIYSMASPLWNSPYGHHMSCFEGHPWVHLCFEPSEIVEYAKAQGIEGERGRAVEHIVGYMMNPAYFNRVSAETYLDAISLLPSLSLVENRIDAFDNKRLLNHKLAATARAKGYSDFELTGLTHRLIARKT
jgi:SAM-dependent methyltransferase